MDRVGADSGNASNNNTYINIISDYIALTDVAKELLHKHCDLVMRWNVDLGLVSRGDEGELWRRHVEDSLSLLPYLPSGGNGALRILDIGAGAGFPGVPLAIARPDATVWLLERSQRRASFLRVVKQELRLENVEILEGEFPRAARGLYPTTITARAVEKPGRLMKAILKFMPEGCAYLCQCGESSSVWGPRFHVEHIEESADDGPRRGSLRVIRKREDD